MKAILLVLLMLSLGCIASQGPSQISRSAGLMVSGFYAEDTELRSEDMTNMVLELENVGDAEAGNIDVSILNTGGFAVDSPVYQKTLSPPDAGTNMPGGRDKIVWRLTAPKVDFPVRKSVKVKIGFDYMAELDREIPIITYDKSKAGGAQKGGETSSEGPVSIRILSEDPILLPSGKTAGTANFKIILENTGEGTVRTSKANPAGWCQGETLDCIDQVKVEIISSDPAVHNYAQIGCEDANGALAFSRSVALGDMKLWKGGNTVINCKISIDMQDSDERHLVLKTTAAYRYYYENELQFSLV